MHPLLADPRRLLTYLVACALAGAAGAALMRLQAGLAWADALLLAVPLAVLYGFVALSAYYLCRALPQPVRRGAVVATRFGGAALVAAAAWVLAAEAWNAAGTLGAAGRPFIEATPAGRLALFVAGVVLYTLSLLAHDVLVAFETVREAARREAESRVLARDAELRLLRTQIDPHFLFNSLNSISALTAFDAEAAREMTIDLAQFFRRTLALAGRERIPLAEELALCRHFVAIERRRFGERLRVDWRVDPAAEPCVLPPMTLQPLIENALKHGLRALPGGGTIAIDAVARDGWLHLAVTNPVAADEAPVPEGHGLGLGLANIRARLAMLHGDRARALRHRDGGTFRIEITLPAEADPAAGPAADTGASPPLSPSPPPPRTAS